MKPKVSIIILNWNGIKDTLECLKSVYGLRTTDYRLETIMVDNGSTDVDKLKTTAQKLSKAWLQLKLIENNKNLGYAEGNNVGIRRALKDGADFVFILNNDTILDKNTIVDLLRVANKYKNAGILSPKIYFAKGYEYHKDRYKKDDLGRVIWAAGGDIDWSNVYGSNRGVDEVDRGQHDGVCETDFATGAAMFIRREVLEKLGGFDSDYFMYIEDADLCVRAKKLGWKVFYAPPAHLSHKVSRSSKIGGNLQDYFITRNRLVFGMRYAPIRAKVALVKESVRLLFAGRPWQKRGVLDFYLHRLGCGSLQN